AAAEAGIAERDGAFTDLVRAGHPVAGPRGGRARGAGAPRVTHRPGLLSPDVVVIGGGVGANNGDIVLPRIAAWLERHGPAVDEPIALATASLGDDAGLAGAARWFAAVTDDGAQ
ncbi:MAG: ROK family protein, partial [Actinomycetota bacterium]